MDVADRTFELLKHVQGDLVDIKRGQASMGLHLTSIEQHLAASQKEIAGLSSNVASIKDELAHIKRRLNLGDA